MNRRFLIPAFLLAMIVAATGIVIWTYDGPASAPQSLSSSQAKLAWQLRSQANTLIQGRKFLEAERVLSRLLKLERTTSAPSGCWPCAAMKTASMIGPPICSVFF